MPLTIATLFLIDAENLFEVWEQIRTIHRLSQRPTPTSFEEMRSKLKALKDKLKGL